jgi:hypothetical protein
MRVHRLTLLVPIAGLVFGMATLPTAAQEASTTPPPDSADRKSILDAMRSQGNLRGRIFIVRSLKVERVWAWLTGITRRQEPLRN